MYQLIPKDLFEIEWKEKTLWSETSLSISDVY